MMGRDGRATLGGILTLGVVPILGPGPSVSLSLSLPASTPVDSTPPRPVLAWSTRGSGCGGGGGRESVSPGAMRDVMLSLFIT